MSDHTYNHRIQILEQQLQVMQSEISQVLGEMQTSVQALAKMTQVGLRLMDERLRVLEPIPVPEVPSESSETSPG